MARDYKPRSGKATGNRRKASKPAASNPPPRPRRTWGWLWMSFGFALGLVVAFGVHVYHTGELPGSAYAGNDTTASRAVRDRAPAEEHRRRAEFSFYSLLPEMEVTVPDGDVASRQQNRTEVAKLRPERSSPDRYILQAGAFRNLADADRLKASLALSGLEATIQTVAVDGNNAWYRVRLGPYSDLPRVRDIRARLRRSNIDAMVLKITI